MPNDIETSITEQLATMGVTFTARYMGQTQRDQKWDCDEWRVKLVRNGKAFETDYYTGLGHRKSKVKMPEHLRKLSPLSIARARWDRENLEPQVPHAAGVLHSLVSDATAINESFSDWCDMYSMDSDSIKAFETYRACCETGKNLRTIFSSAELSALSELLRDY